MLTFNFVLDQLFPEKCPFCGKENIELRKPLCVTCLKKIEPINPEHRCLRCGGITAKNGCLCSQRKFFFDHSSFLWPYRREGRRLLKQAKFQERSSAIRYIKNMIPTRVWQYLEEMENSAMLPMPSSHHFIHQISKFLSFESDIPLHQVFYKKKKKLQSKLLHAKDRFLQIEKNLALDHSKFKQVMTKKACTSFILIDDIWTSGATINFAAKLLSEAGVPQENIFVMALFKRDTK